MKFLAHGALSASFRNEGLTLDSSNLNGDLIIVSVTRVDCNYIWSPLAHFSSSHYAGQHKTWYTLLKKYWQRLARRRGRESCNFVRTKRGSYGCGVTAALTKHLACQLSKLSRLHLLRQLNLRERTMSVLLETSLGDITIDLLVDDAPKCCEK